MRAARKRAAPVSSPNASAAHVSDDDTIPVDMSPEEALQAFVVAKWCSGEWSNTDIVAVSHLVTQAGGHGLEALSQDPSKKGDNASRKVQRALGVHAGALHDQLYFVDAPCHDKSKDQRCVIRVPIRLAHEALSSQFDKDPLAFDVESHDPADFCTRSYQSHPIVQQHAWGDTDRLVHRQGQAQKSNKYI